MPREPTISALAIERSRRLRRAAPTLGEHTQEVLSGLLGLSDDEITRYALAGVLS